MPNPLIMPIALSVRKDSLRKSSLLKIFEICNSTNGIFDPIKASRIEIEVCVNAPAFIRIPWDTFYRLLNFIYYFSFMITLKTFKINTLFISNFC